MSSVSESISFGNRWGESNIEGVVSKDGLKQEHGALQRKIKWTAEQNILCKIEQIQREPEPEPATRSAQEPWVSL